MGTPMPADLEAQLRASLPGRATEVVDFSALCIARKAVKDALRDLDEARGVVATILGNGHLAVEHIAAASIEGSKAVLDLDRAIKNHPAGKGGKVTNRRTLAEARLIARTSDPDWLGEELFRLQEQAAALESELATLRASVVAAMSSAGPQDSDG